MALDEAPKVAGIESWTWSSCISDEGGEEIRLSKEQLDLLVKALKSNSNPSAEQTSELAEKLKLTPGQVQIWFRKEILGLQKMKEALTLEIELLSRGIETPELRRSMEQDEELRRIRDETKVLQQVNELLDKLLNAGLPEQQDNEQLTKLIAALPNGRLKLQLDELIVLEQEKEQLTKSMDGLELLLSRLEEKMVGAVQLRPCHTGTPSYSDERKRASESSSDEQGKKKNARRE